MNLLIADDHRLFLDGLRLMLERAYPGATVVEARDGLEALRCVESLPPFDLALVDLRMPGLDGIEFLRRFDAQHIATPVVILSGSDEPADVAAALDAGALGYITKQVTSEVLKGALDQVLDGNVYVPAALAREVSRWRESRRALASTVQLSRRQLDVLRLMGQGLGNAEIGEQLKLSEATVKTHVAALLRATGTANRTACARAAIRLGLIA
jgi:DNA-binding NarL/FixJ family response regulator